MSEATLRSIRPRMERDVGRHNNGHSDGVFYCCTNGMRANANYENRAAF